jgi:hypothetical protein
MILCHLVVVAASPLSLQQAIADKGDLFRLHGWEEEFVMHAAEEKAGALSSMSTDLMAART